MLNKEGFVLLAGKPDKWDAELTEECRNGAQLPQVQERQFRQGRRHAELMRSMYGWYVRSGTGLDGFALMFTPRQDVADKGFFEAFTWGCAWAEEDAENREFYVRRFELRERGEEILGSFMELTKLYGQVHSMLERAAGKAILDGRPW